MTPDQLALHLQDRASQLTEPLRVLEVGARWGIVDAWQRFENVLQVEAIEVDSEECARLNKMSPSWCRYHDVALGSGQGSATLHIAVEPACSSLYPPRDDLVEAVSELGIISTSETVQVETMSVDKFLADRQLSGPHVIKLDTQGSEFDTLLRPLGFELWRLNPLVHYGKTDEDLPGTRLETFFSDRQGSVVDEVGQLFWGQAYYVRRDFGLTGSLPSADAGVRVAIGAFALGLYDLAARLANLAELHRA